jgi:hypothetical protein
MKKKLLLIFIVFSVYSNAQLTQHQFHFSTKYSSGSIDSALYNNFSLNFEVIVHNNIGLNYNFDLLFRNDNVHQIHAPMGLIGGPLLMLAGLASGSDSTSSGGGLVLLGVLLLVLPDGVSFHIPAGYQWDISPYANLLGIDFIKNRTSNENWIKYACSFGARVNYVLKDKYTFSGFLETRKTAGIPLGIGGGFGIGIAFGERNKEEDAEFTE